MITGKTGVSTDTPKSIMFGAGTIHKGLTYTAGTGGASGSWNFASSCIGATQGGSKITITPEFTDVEADGAAALFRRLDAAFAEHQRVLRGSLFAAFAHRAG